MKLAVIGANGFIGSRIVESFHLGEGPSVVAVSVHASQHTLAARFAVTLRTANPADADALEKALAGCSIAIHAATPPGSELKAVAASLARAAAAAGVRKIVYVGNALAEAAPSKSKPDAGSAAQAHATAERQLLSDCRKAGIPAYVLRPGIVYGPRMPLVAEIATELRDESAWLLRGGQAVFDGLYIDNLITAIRLCLQTKAAAGDAYVLGDAETVTWRDLYHTIARELELSASNIRYVESVAALRDSTPGMAAVPAALIAQRDSLQQATTKLSHAAATKALGYTPSVFFEEGIRRCCAWWRFALGDFRAAA